jgi:hypothetical protein
VSPNLAQRWRSETGRHKPRVGGRRCWRRWPNAAWRRIARAEASERLAIGLRVNRRDDLFAILLLTGGCMSGVENLRGIDYQISCSVLVVLQMLADDEADLSEISIDSLDDTGEDLTISFLSGGSLHIQIKKLTEGYNWTATTLRPVLSRFATFDIHSQCWFITDGSASRQVHPLRSFLAGDSEIAQDLLDEVSGEGLTIADLNALAGRVRLMTRYFPSPDAADPAALVRGEILRLLVRGPFSLADDPAIITPKLWNVLYQAGVTGRSLANAELIAEFAASGLSLLQREWAVYPTAEEYYDHEEPVERVAQLFTDGALALVYGIGGSGKTTFTAEAASMVTGWGRRTCWITVNELLEPAELVRVIGEYCIAEGLLPAAERLRGSEVVRIGSDLAEIVNKQPVTFVLDRFETANARLEPFIREVISALSPTGRHGSILITSRSIPDWWPDIERMKEQVQSIPLGGLPPASAIKVLADAGIGETEEERSEIVAALGRHAQSVTLLRQLHSAIPPHALQQVGIEATRDWLLRQVMDQLPPALKVSLARLSVFDYAAPRDLALSVLDDLGPDTLRALVKRDLVRIDLGAVTVHDSIREAALSLLSTQANERCHRAVADYLYREIQRDYRTEGSVLYEKSIRWAAHLESSGDVSDLGGRTQFILDAEPVILRDLFGIATRGFPYEFDDPTLDDTFAFIEELEEAGIIEENPANAGKDVWVEPPYRLRGFSFYEELLLKSLCLRHGFAEHVGYMDDMRANYAFEAQALTCPWEHCIELSPLPGMTRAEYEASLEDDRRRLANPAGLSEKHRQILLERINEGIPDWMAEERDEELHARSCPIFGHACPSGRAQAEVCTANDGDVFLWADKPVPDSRAEEPDIDLSSA